MNDEEFYDLCEASRKMYEVVEILKRSGFAWLIREGRLYPLACELRKAVTDALKQAISDNPVFTKKEN